MHSIIKLFYGEIKQGSRKVGAPQLRYKDVFKRHLKNIGEYDSWGTKTQNRLTWKKIVARATAANRDRNIQLWTEETKEQGASTPIDCVSLQV